MRRCLIISGIVILTLGMIQVAGAQTDTDAGQSKPSWFQRLWPFHKKKAPPAPVVKGPSPAELAAAKQAREKANYLRRIDVCDKLRDIAFQTGDNELFRKADQLDQRAFAIYKKCAGQVPGEYALQADEHSLQRSLGRNAPAAQGLLPAQRASGSQASLREE